MYTAGTRRYVVFFRGDPGTPAEVAGWVNATDKSLAVEIAQAQHTDRRVFVQRWTDATAEQKRQSLDAQALLQKQLHGCDGRD